MSRRRMDPRRAIRPRRHWASRSPRSRHLQDGLRGWRDRIRGARGSTIAKLVNAAFEENCRAEQRRKDQLAREEASRRRREEEARAAEEQKKIDRWDKWMAAWKKAAEVRAFASAIREKLGPIEEGSTMARWLGWAAAYANRIDPLLRSDEG